MICGIENITHVECFLGVSEDLYRDITVGKLRDLHFSTARESIEILVIRDDGQCCLESEYEERRLKKKE
jgi:hypothetical protein